MTDKSSAAARAALLERAFGPPAEIVLDPDPSPLEVEVAIHPPGFADRSFYTLCTRGMSARPMAVPADVESSPRAEIVLYVDQPGPTFVALVRTLAKLPHADGQWLGAGHTLPNGAPPAALFPGSALDTILVLETVVAPERDLKKHAEVDGDPLMILWPVPITAAECALKVEQGAPALLELFNERQLSFVLDSGRESLV